MEEKTEFLLKRASQEAARAITSDNRGASAAHQKMAVLYSAKALLELSETETSITKPE